MQTIDDMMRTTLKDYANITFLALTVWREARGQSEEGQRAVAHSILNRVARPSWWGDDVLSVLFKRLQYSSLTYPKDPQLTTWPEHADDPAWMTALHIACEVCCGCSDNPVPGADSYHDISIAAPAWAKPARFVRQIGRIRFFDVDHDYEAGALQR